MTTTGRWWFHRSTVCAAAGGLLISGLLAGPAVGAASAGERQPGSVVSVTDGVLQACVRKRSGRIRLMTGSQCRRGERRITWNNIGPAGPIGPAGGTLVVTDGSGRQVPNVVTVDGGGISVLIGSGIFSYRWDGHLDVEEAPYHFYLGATCSGTRILPFASPVLVVGGPLRIVVRNPDSTVSVLAAGPVQTLAAGTIVSTYVGSPLACVPIGPIPSEATVTTLPVDTAPVPADLPGPLRLSLT